MTQIKVELQETMGSDKSIAEAAWTSSLDYQKKETRTEGDIKRVVQMLADSKHSVPFESVVFRFWMRIPVATDRQIMTHRIASHSGMSGRYRTMPGDYLKMPQDVIDIIKVIEEVGEPALAESFTNDYDTICQEANVNYQNIVAYFRDLKNKEIITNDQYKRIREFYRGMLPQHNMTERVTIINLRSWCNFYRLRSKADAQPEIREVAQLMLSEIEKANVAPIAIDCLKKNDWNI